MNPNDYVWRFCARDGSNETCECATPGALVRFGSTGEPEYYAKNSTWFADHPFVRKFDYASLRPGATKTICDARTFVGSDPFPDQDKVCHCADRGAIPEDQPLVTFVREDVRPAPPSVVAGENAATGTGERGFGRGGCRARRQTTARGGRVQASAHPRQRRPRLDGRRV